MTKDDFARLAREEAKTLWPLVHNMLQRNAFRRGASFGFDKGVEAVMEILEGELGREAFRINTHSVAISILKRKLAMREDETK